jgi:hypothetical protein
LAYSWGDGSLAHRVEQSSVSGPGRVHQLRQVTQAHCGASHTILSVTVRIPAPLPPRPSVSTDFWNTSDGMEESLDFGSHQPSPSDQCTGVPSLVSLCESRLTENVPPRTLLPLLRFAARSQSWRLLYWCSVYLLLNIDYYVRRAMF